MGKRLTLVILAATLLAGSVAGRSQRVSVLFIHYSVGTSIVQGYCWGDEWRRNITETLDTMTVAHDIDTARIVFHSYRMNNDAGFSALSDTLPGSDENGCAFDRFNNFTYDLFTSQYNRVRIWNDDGGFGAFAYAGLLDHFFAAPNKEQQTFWRMFKTHNTPSSFPDSVSEIDGYDLVIIKNPYACWLEMTQAQADSIRHLYQIIRDTVANHPEINFAFAFGTPLRLGEISDTVRAKITYELASWFASDSFFTHSNTGPYKNLWKWDSYRPMCELTEGAVNRYCLKEEYYGGGGSHLNPQLGATTAQESLLGFLRTAIHDIVVQRSGVPAAVTREDIDRVIYEFKQGTATEAEVLEMIRQYNTGER